MSPPALGARKSNLNSGGFTKTFRDVRYGHGWPGRSRRRSADFAEDRCYDRLVKMGRPISGDALD